RRRGQINSGARHRTACDRRVEPDRMAIAALPSLDHMLCPYSHSDIRRMDSNPAPRTKCETSRSTLEKAYIVHAFDLTFRRSRESAREHRDDNADDVGSVSSDTARSSASRAMA